MEQRRVEGGKLKLITIFPSWERTHSRLSEANLLASEEEVAFLSEVLTVALSKGLRLIL